MMGLMRATGGGSGATATPSLDVEGQREMVGSLFAAARSGVSTLRSPAFKASLSHAEVTRALSAADIALASGAEEGERV